MRKLVFKAAQPPKRLRRLDHHHQGEAWATTGTSQHLPLMSALPPKADIG
jgi:hypothetical protein